MELVTPTIQQFFDKAKRIVFLTGAGVSTASGIPDYRSKGGLYDQKSNLPPEYLLSIDALEKQPELQYQFITQNMFFPDTKPNIIHKKIASFASNEKASVITQNVDGLHLLASQQDGQEVFEFHGNIYNIIGVKDGQPSSWQDYLKSMYRSNDHELLRPDITMYGEEPKKVQESIIEVQQADLIVIVGTSFQVYPFASLVNYASPNTKIIAVNKQVIQTNLAIEQIQGDAVTFFEELSV